MKDSPDPLSSELDELKEELSINAAKIIALGYRLKVVMVVFIISFLSSMYIISVNANSVIDAILTVLLINIVMFLGIVFYAITKDIEKLYNETNIVRKIIQLYEK
jgi:uncharacterized protein YqhQ